MSKKTPIQQSLFKSVEDKIKFSTSSVEELRVPIYAPVKQLPPQSTAAIEFKKNKNVRTIQTKWGYVEIRNRLLTQTHKDIMDIMDIIFTYKKHLKRLDDGSIAVYFSQSEISKIYSGTSDDDESSSSKNLKWFRQKLDEISDCRIQYRDNNGNEIDFRIILKKAFSTKENLYGIVLDTNYVEFYEKGLSVNYSSKVPDLISIESPLVKSIIRFFFTHKAINLSLENILQTVGFPMPASIRTMQTTKKSLKENIDVFERFGIRYDPKKEIFYYSGTNDIYINKPIVNLTEVLPKFKDD